MTSRSDLHPMRPAALPALLLLAVSLPALGPAGCSDDDPARPPDEPVDSPAASPDEAVADFAAAYETEDLEAYDGALHAEFAFVPLSADLEDLGLSTGEVLPRTQEMAIAQRLFGGVVGRSGAPGIRSIDIIQLDRLTEWQDSIEPRFAAGQAADYLVEVHFGHADGYYRVLGRQRFWAADVPERDGTPHWYVLGQQELPLWPKAVGEDTWGGVKGLYR